MQTFFDSQHLSRVMRKPAFCICDNKDADQLYGNRTADQRLCFRYTDSTILLLFKASSHLLWLYSPVCVGPGRKPRRLVFSQRGSFQTGGKRLDSSIFKAVTDQRILSRIPSNARSHVRINLLFFHIFPINIYNGKLLVNNDSSFFIFIFW